jgi:hypothetical protein
MAAPVVLTATLAPAAVAQTPQPTLAFDHPCYAAQEPIGFSGAGYTPNGLIDMLFTANGRAGSDVARADPAGHLAGVTAVPEEDLLLTPGQNRVTVAVTANDRTRVDANQQPPESQFGAAAFTFTRSWTVLPRTLRAGRRAPVRTIGWTTYSGKRLYILLFKGRQRKASVPLGRLKGDCGDLRKSVRVPRKLAKGRYTVVVSLSRVRRGHLYVEFKRVRVR